MANFRPRTPLPNNFRNPYYPPITEPTSHAVATPSVVSVAGSTGQLASIQSDMAEILRMLRNMSDRLDRIEGRLNQIYRPINYQARGAGANGQQRVTDAF